MWLLRKPSIEFTQRFIERQRSLDFSYAAVGATATTPPTGYVVDHTRIKLGNGGEAFHAAKAALEQWEHFHLGWLEALPPQASIQTGEVVAVGAYTAGVWWLNACRIVYVVDDRVPIRRFGFAYGTLPDHAASGEERFLIEWNPGDDSVWYDILALSRPHHFLAKVGYPIVRRMQNRFGRESAAAMQRWQR